MAAEVASLLLFYGTLLVSIVFLAGALFHIRQDVAFVPSSQRIVDAMIDAADIKAGERVIDLGAGDGRFLIRASRRFPHATVIGYEGAYWVYLLGRLRLLFSNCNAQLCYKNFFSVDLSKADVIFTYLSIHAMKRLEPKFQRELKPGARVVSHVFSLPGVVPSRTVQVPMHGGTTTVLVYRWPTT